MKLCVYPWPNPVGDIEFWVNWLNYSREHLTCDYHIQLDADEVLHENSFSEVLSHKTNHPHSVFCKRYNFWRDHKHLIPHGVVCSHNVVRIAPSTVWLPSDGPHPLGSEAVQMAVQSNIEIFHFGFIRKREAFFKKERLLQKMFFNTHDKRLEAVESLPGNWMSEIKEVEWINKLIPYNGSYPKYATKWLTDRGYEL